jgi:hypothetical protein
MDERPATGKRPSARKGVLLYGEERRKGIRNDEKKRLIP